MTVDATERNLPVVNVDLDVDQFNPEYDDSRNAQIIAGVPLTNYRSPVHDQGGMLVVREGID